MLNSCQDSSNHLTRVIALMHRDIPKTANCYGFGERKSLSVGGTEKLYFTKVR